MEHCENIRREQEKLIAALRAQVDSAHSQQLLNLEALEASIVAMKNNFEHQKQQMYQNESHLQPFEAKGREIATERNKQLAIEAPERSVNPTCIPRDPALFTREDFGKQGLTAPPSAFTFAGKIVPKEHWKHPTTHLEVLSNCSIQLNVRCRNFLYGESHQFTCTNCKPPRNSGWSNFNTDSKVSPSNLKPTVEFGGPSRDGWTIHGELSFYTREELFDKSLELTFTAMMKRQNFQKGVRNQLWQTGRKGLEVLRGKAICHREPANSEHPNEITGYDVRSTGTQYANTPDHGDEMWFKVSGGGGSGKCAKY